MSGSDDFTIILWEPSVSLQPKKTHLTGPPVRLTGHQQVTTTSYLKFKTLFCFCFFEILANANSQQLVNHVYFSPNGQWIASASFDKSVKLWNGVTGDFISAFRGHVGPVYQISWSADSRMLLSCSKDSTLKVKFCFT